jgi:hypothetical protein
LRRNGFLATVRRAAREYNQEKSKPPKTEDIGYLNAFELVDFAVWLWSLRHFEGDPPTREYVMSTDRLWVDDLLRYRRQIAFEKHNAEFSHPTADTKVY